MIIEGYFSSSIITKYAFNYYSSTICFCPNCSVAYKNSFREFRTAEPENLPYLKELMSYDHGLAQNNKYLSLLMFYKFFGRIY